MEKPILFNGEMVRAILDGRKTQTRRVAFPAGDLQEFPRPNNPDAWIFRGREYSSFNSFVTDPVTPKCRYKAGDTLWVRETWQYTDATLNVEPGYVYRATDPDWQYMEGWTWRPSIHMPRDAARIFLRVTDVRVERLKDITISDAWDEGFSDWNDLVRVWESTIKPADRDRYGWFANPWVWAITFEQCRP